MVEVAVGYMDMGWKVFPVQGKYSKDPEGYKAPATMNGLKDASSEHRLAGIWWNRYPDRGIAVATGAASGFWVLDLDGPEGKAAFLELQQRHGDIPNTVAAKTGNGFHLFFQMPDSGDVRNSAKRVADGIDVRGSGGYVVLPPSPHPSGTLYEWVAGRAPEQAPIAAAPEWLIDLVVTKQSSRARAEPVEEEIIEGGRNHALTSLAGTMRRRGMGREAILAALLAENDTKCRPPLDDAEVEKIAESVARYDPSAPVSPPQNGTNPSPPSSDPPPTRLDLVTLDVLNRIAVEKTKPIEAVPTPWPKWNRACRGAGGGVGLARGWHVIVGASSGAGKSLIAANMAAAAVRNGVDVCLFSLEMSQLENVTRVLAIMTGEHIAYLEHGRGFDVDRWNAAAERFLEQPGTLSTNERPIHSLAQISEAMKYHADQGCRLMIVDYLQLAWVGNAETLYNQITEVSHTIQGLAKDLRVTTIGLSQVNRRTSSGADKLAKEGLMGGSSLENDAEQVVLLSKPERQYDGFISDVRLDKNRHGPVAEWQMRMDPKNLQMVEVAA